MFLHNRVSERPDEEIWAFTRFGYPTSLAMRATHLVQAIGTKFALPADACHPFDSDPITLLP